MEFELIHIARLHLHGKVIDFVGALAVFPACGDLRHAQVLGASFDDEGSDPSPLKVGSDLHRFVQTL